MIIFGQLHRAIPELKLPTRAKHHIKLQHDTEHIMSLVQMLYLY